VRTIANMVTPNPFVLTVALPMPGVNDKKGAQPGAGKSDAVRR
jgi:hypothetical protein